MSTLENSLIGKAATPVQLLQNKIHNSIRILVTYRLISSSEEQQLYIRYHIRSVELEVCATTIFKSCVF